MNGCNYRAEIETKLLIQDYLGLRVTGLLNKNLKNASFKRSKSMFSNFENDTIYYHQLHLEMIC